MFDLMPHISLWEPLLVNKAASLLLSLFYKETNGFLHEVPHLSLNFYISDNLYIIIYIYKSWFVNDWLVYNLLLTVIINSWNNTKYNETQTHYQFTVLFCIHPNFCKIHANNCNYIKKVKQAGVNFKQPTNSQCQQIHKHVANYRWNESYNKWGDGYLLHDG